MPARPLTRALAIAALWAHPSLSAASCVDYLSALGASAEEAHYWSRASRSRDVVFTISSTLRFVDEAAPETWELLALTRLGPLASLDTFVDEYVRLMRGRNDLAQLEVLLDTELGEVRDELGAVLALGRYGSAATRAWFGQLMRVPGRVFVLARVLAESSTASYAATRSFLVPHRAPLLKLNLARLRKAVPSGRGGWRDLVGGSRLLAANLIDHRVRFYRHEKRAVTVDLEAMGEWTLDRVAPRADGPASAAPDPVPAHWTKFHAGLFDALEAPPHRQTKGPDGFTEGDALLAGLASGAAEDLQRLQIEAYGDGLEWKAGALAAACLTSAYAEGLVNLEGGARALTLVLDAMGLTFPAGPELKRNFPAHLAAVLGDSLREHYPLGGRGQVNLECAEPACEPAAPSAPVAVAPPPAPAPPGEVADDLPPFAALAPGHTYRVRFRRPHVKFTGTQRVRFTEEALAAMAAHAEVEPDAWLEALRMGIALAHGQRGLKLLNFGVKRASCGGLPAEIKLLLSNYRVTGDFCEGAWTFSGVSKGH